MRGRWQVALIKCPECGREISDRAASCPNCGYPLVNAAPSRPSADAEPKPDSNTQNQPAPAGGLAGAAPEPAGTTAGTAPDPAGTTAGTAPEPTGTTAGAEKDNAQVPGKDPAVSESEEWFAKGRAAGWSSTTENIRLGEAVAAFQNSIATAGDNEKRSISARCTEEVNHLITTLHGLSKKRLVESLALPDTWTCYTEQVTRMISALEEAAKWDNSNKTIPEKIVYLCKDLIEGVAYRDQLDNNKSKVWRLPAEQESEIRTRLAVAARKLKNLDPLYIAPNPTARKPEPCFIATATLGNPYHPKVVFMREFRDECLVRGKPGTLLVKLYGQFGPAAAGLIAGSRILRALSYGFIVIPAYWIAKGVFRRKPGG